MITIDGKTLDLTKPETYAGKVTLTQADSYMLQKTDGTLTLVTPLTVTVTAKVEAK